MNLPKDSYSEFLGNHQVRFAHSKSGGTPTSVEEEMMEIWIIVNVGWLRRVVLQKPKLTITVNIGGHNV